MGRPPKNKTIDQTVTTMSAEKVETIESATPKVFSSKHARMSYTDPGTGCTTEELYTSITEKLTQMRNNNLEKGAGAEEHKDKAELLKYELLTRAAAILDGNTKPKCDLANIDDVKNRATVYITSCAETNTYPSIMGLAVHAFGMSRQNLLAYVKNHPESPTAEYIGELTDMFADVLTNASLQNRANVVQTIFQLKNHFGHTDKQEVTIVAPGSSEQKPEELYNEIESLPEG